MTAAPRHVVTLLAAALAACAASSPKAPPPPAPPPPPHEADPSFDWQALVIAPFGSTLKSIPVKVHEALLFKDDARASGGDDGECYAPDAAVPRFLGRPPDEYLLCFRQDRLLRVRAAVRLDDSDAPGAFAEACERWMKTVDAAAHPGGDAAPPPGAATVCRGRSGKVRFDARLGADIEPGTTPAAGSADEGSTVFMVLDGTTD